MAILSSTNSAESISAAIMQAVNQGIDNLRVCTPAYITKVNSNYTVNVQPLNCEYVRQKYGSKKAVALPEIYNVPYLYVLKPKVKDFCILIHLDSPINTDNVIENKINGADALLSPNTGAKHTLSDCVAIVGFSFGVGAKIQPDTDIEKMSLEDSILPAAVDPYPIGAVYISFDKSKTPDQLFGGVWEELDSRFLYAVGASKSVVAGQTFGTADSVLLKHNHIADIQLTGGDDWTETYTTEVDRMYIPQADNNVIWDKGTEVQHTPTFHISHTDDAGTLESGTGQNMPPAITVYMWKRIDPNEVES